jgi:hypothetical protein
VPLANIDYPPPGVSMTDGSTLVFHDFDNRIVMLQQRIETDTGKDYVPWTRWSDGEWRRMEPEGGLPFYGLPGAKDSHILFLHEGAKAAEAMRKRVSGDIKDPNFPWLEDMRYGCHIGWIGGTNAVGKSDWSRLAALGWRNVYIITDNDPKGHNIAPEIARHFRCPTFAIILDRDFPLGFDMADPFPGVMFTAEGKYIGEPFRNYLRPCTWATNVEVIPPEGRGRPTRVIEIRDEFAEQWAWIKDHDWFINLHLTQFIYESSTKFNAGMLPLSDAKDTASLLQKRLGSAQYGLTYDPSTEARIVNSSMGLSQINVYQPSPVRPLEGDYKPFLEFMEYLIPDPVDRHEVSRWCATLIARPGVRMSYGLLMMSEQQGTGKTTLGESILADIVGPHNTSFPSERAIADSDFNGWAVNKRLIVVNEIYHGHSWKAYNSLKSYVTDRHLEANIKFMATYTIPNWTHFYLSSNSRAALKIDTEDRRWLVPLLTERIWPEQKFQEFYRWLQSGGLSYISYWAHTFEKRGEGEYVRAGSIAPMTNDKKRLIEESMSDEQKLYLDFSTAMKECKEPVAVSLTHLRTWAEEEGRDRSFFKPESLGRFLIKQGLWTTGQIKVAGRLHRLIVNRAEMREWEAEDLRKSLRAPADMLGQLT